MRDWKLAVNGAFMNDREFLDDYYARLCRAARVDGALGEGIIQLRDAWRKTGKAGGRVLLFGNGGSAAICAHIAIDLSKNAGIPAMSFDVAAVTCLANDYGHENWMRSAIDIWATPADSVVVISSSGKSLNTIAAAARARERKLSVATLTGMAADNPLRALGTPSLWCDSDSYNIVETSHQFWLMAAVDLLIGSPVYSASKPLRTKPTS